MSLVDDEDLPRSSRSRGVRLAGKVGETFTFTVPADSNDRYVIQLGAARRQSLGVMNCWPAGIKSAGSPHWSEGPMRWPSASPASPSKADRCELIVDFFKVDAYRNMITDWMIVGPFPNPDEKGLDIEYPPEKAVDLGAAYQGVDVVRSDGGR